MNNRIIEVPLKDKIVEAWLDWQTKEQYKNELIKNYAATRTALNKDLIDATKMAFTAHTKYMKLIIAQNENINSSHNYSIRQDVFRDTLILTDLDYEEPSHD